MASPVKHLVKRSSTNKAEVRKVGITAVYFDIIIIMVSYVMLFIHYALTIYSSTICTGICMVTKLQH